MHHSVRPRERALKVLLVLAMCVALVPVGSAGAIVVLPTTWYIDAVSGDNANSGTSAADALLNIQTALDIGGPGDTIVLLPGTYDDSGEDWPVDITYPVTIESQDGPDTTFIGDAGGHALFDVSFAGSVTIEGLTFSNGISGSGGAIASNGSSLYVTDCVFTGNTAEAGGAIYFGSGLVPFSVTPSFEADSIANMLSLDGCTFEANGNPVNEEPFGVAEGDPVCYEGGAVFAAGAITEISGCDFLDNGAEYVGPAVSLVECNALVADTVFDGNQVTVWFQDEIMPVALADPFSTDKVAALSRSSQRSAFEMDAGALAVEYSTIQVRGVTFSDNFAFNGAGMAVVDSSFQVSDTTFSDNFTFTGAFSAAESYEADTVIGPPLGDISTRAILPQEVSTIERSVFTGTNGGAYAMSLTTMAPAQVLNSVFYDNGYGTGGLIPAAVEEEPEMAGLFSVIYASYGEPVLNSISPKGAPPVSVVNCTIADNSAMYGVAAPSGYAIVNNSIVWNGIGEGSLLDTSNSNCDLETAPETSAEEPPLLPLVDNPWFSLDPEFVDPENADYRVQPWSPCVDTGMDLPGLVDEDFDGTARPKDGNEDGISEWDIGAFEVDPWSDTRIGGEDRYATSVKVAQRHFPFGSQTVILATGRKFADGLTGSALAGAYEAPLLLTDRDVLPEVVAQEIVRLGASHIIVLGGIAAISEPVASALEELDGVEMIGRIGGIDRYETAAMIADEVIAIEEDREGFGGTFFIARGDLFADALTASPVAWANRIPILLVETNELPEATIDAVVAAGAARAIVLGGEAAVSASVSSQVAALVDGSERITGTDRYDTSANFSEWAVAESLAQWDAVGVATGEKFPDALSGGPGIGSRGGLVLLTPAQSMNSSIEDVLQANGGSVTSLEVFGGVAAVSADVYDALMALVNIPG